MIPDKLYLPLEESKYTDSTLMLLPVRHEASDIEYTCAPQIEIGAYRLSISEDGESLFIGNNEHEAGSFDLKDFEAHIDEYFRRRF